MGLHLRCACLAFLINGVGLRGSPAVSANVLLCLPSLPPLFLLSHITLTLQAVEQILTLGDQGAPQNPWLGDSLVEVFAASVGESL